MTTQRGGGRARKAPAKKPTPARSEPVTPDPPLSVRAAVETDDRELMLRATARQLADRIDSPGSTGAEVASLARQLVRVTAELERIAAPKEADPVDDLERKRAERTQGHAGTASAGGVPRGGQRRTRGA